jgi:2-polyprenyl-3-methyl-5-hydroxy-6-metoxy-1,4-benzoquinol methylase
LGVNLALEESSLNDVDHVEEFDYIICTGVVHHNARPGDTLSRIAKALKADGVLELMVESRRRQHVETAHPPAIHS